MGYSIWGCGHCSFKGQVWRQGRGRREVHGGTMLLGETWKDGERNLCFWQLKHPEPHGVQVGRGRFEMATTQSVTTKNHLIFGHEAAMGMKGRRKLTFSEHLLGAKKQISSWGYIITLILEMTK